MSTAEHWRFESFRLDPDNACLWHGDAVIALKPKAFAVLQYLVQHAGQLVTKDILLEACWPETVIGDAVLKVCIGDLRKLLGDTAQGSRFIATIHRRGYRFVAPVTRIGLQETATITARAVVPEAPVPVVPADFSLAPASEPLFEREMVLQRLHAAWKRACQGQRQVVWVSGEAGIGKTAVVDAFTAQVAADPAVWLARGQCVEQYGTSEAYLPILDALGQLCRLPQGERLVALLRQQAPTWLVQMPWLLRAEDRELLRQEFQGVTRERMLREFAEVVDTLTAETPLLLVLEDLHWSDYATLDLVALLARRRGSARLLLLGTYRPVEAIVHNHPLRPMAQTLQQHGESTELPLSLLSVEAVEAYLLARFPAPQRPTALAVWLHQRTEGNPLFLVAIVEALMAQGALQGQEGGWTLEHGRAADLIGVPESLRQMLEHHLTRIPPEAQQVVKAASVAGVTFATAVVAASLEHEVTQIEAHCEALVRQHLLRSVGLSTWPDGTVTARYAFVHALYQQVAYERLGKWERLRLHQRIGVWLETVYGARRGEIATELAEHFVRGQDTPRAVQYLRQAAENAAQRCAPHETVELAQRVLALLATLPESPARLQQELDLQLLLGPALITTRGFATPEVEQTYGRARALCTQVGETPQLFPTLRGLSAFYQTRGELATSRTLGEQLDRLAQRVAAPIPRLEAHDALGSTLFFLGEYAAARAHLESGIALSNTVAQRSQTLQYDQVPGVRCLAIVANTLWCLGYPAQAVSHSTSALAMAQELAHPHTMAFARHHTAFLYHRCRDIRALQVQADALLTLATAQGFPLYAGFGMCWQGWALAMQGQTEAGLEQLRQGMAAVLATGQTLSLPLCLILLAEVMGHVGQAEEGLRLLAEAMTVFATSGRGDLLAEAYRLQGDLLVQSRIPLPASGALTPLAACHMPYAEEAAACFQQALAIARRQQARSWELRAATSLAQLWQRQGQRADARQLLAEVCGWFSEGFDTADVQAARTLLADLG